MVSFFNDTVSELRFMFRDRLVLATMVVAIFLAAFTLASGLQEIETEKKLIERVTSLVTEDRDVILGKQSDAGGAAYYAYHFTYAPPSDLAFASRGMRDDLPWKHRLRMLALEGQIYETDTGNPELSRIGKLDFAFIAAFLLPLLAILLLYDLRSSEIRNNRWDFLSATSGSGTSLLIKRAALRSLFLFLCIAAPFTLTAIIAGSSFDKTLLVIGALALNTVVWLVFSLIVVSRIESGPTAAALLLSIWFITAVAIPVGGKLTVENTITVPKGGEILLMQRETVNGAWDLPKQDTMTPFILQYPEWADASDIKKPFEWKWYFAFQQVGDQTVAPMSKQLHYGITARDKAMALVALASPSLLTARLLSQAAQTNIASFQRYDACVRAFHASLREFHYPMLFGQVKYSAERMSNLPLYEPCTG